MLFIWLSSSFLCFSIFLKSGERENLSLLPSTLFTLSSLIFLNSLLLSSSYCFLWWRADLKRWPRGQVTFTMRVTLPTWLLATQMYIPHSKEAFFWCSEEAGKSEVEGWWWRWCLFVCRRRTASISSCWSHSEDTLLKEEDSYLIVLPLGWIQKRVGVGFPEAEHLRMARSTSKKALMLRKVGALHSKAALDNWLRLRCAMLEGDPHEMGLTSLNLAGLPSKKSFSHESLQSHLNGLPFNLFEMVFWNLI